MPKKTAPTETLRLLENPKIIRSETFSTLYANHTGLTITPWDFAIRFGQIQYLEGQTIIVEMLGVYMSPQHAKAHLALLGEQVARYEQQFGTIPDLPQMAERAAKATSAT